MSARNVTKNLRCRYPEARPRKKNEFAHIVGPGISTAWLLEGHRSTAADSELTGAVRLLKNWNPRTGSIITIEIEREGRKRRRYADLRI
jgi:hypothetical protein